MTSGCRHAGTRVRLRLIACACAVSHSPHDLCRGSRGKECGSRASARRLIPSSVRVTSQLPISRSSSANSARLRAISCFHEYGGFGIVSREAPNLVEMLTVVEYICEDHCIPGREAHLQCFPGSVFRCIAGEIIKDGRCEIRNVSEILRLGYAVRPCISTSVPSIE